MFYCIQEMIQAWTVHHYASQNLFRQLLNQGFVTHSGLTEARLYMMGLGLTSMKIYYFVHPTIIPWCLMQVLTSEGKILITLNQKFTASPYLAFVHSQHVVGHISLCFLQHQVYHRPHCCLVFVEKIPRRWRSDRSRGRHLSCHQRQTDSTQTVLAHACEVNPPSLSNSQSCCCPNLIPPNLSSIRMTSITTNPRRCNTITNSHLPNFSTFQSQATMSHMPKRTSGLRLSHQR